jgi:hypothetical protein
MRGKKMRNSYQVTPTRNSLAVSLGFAASLAAVPVSAASPDAKQLREDAKRYEATYRSVGEPKDRCSLSASLAGGPIIVRTMPASVLRPGDKLMELNGTLTANKSTDEIVAQLRQIPANTTVSVTIERGGRQQTVSVPCTNARATVEPSLQAISLAARGKFDDCVDTINRMSYVDTNVATFKAQCASVSKKYASSAPGLYAQAMELAIADAGYSPSVRPDVVQRLRAVEGFITQGAGANRYRTLVEATERWPGGETIFATSGPDWGLFRRNAETTLRGRLIDPDSARIQWPHGFTQGQWKPFFAKPVQGYWTCGLINARNRMGGYTGTTAFVVVMDANGAVKYSEIGESKEYDMLTASCAKSVKFLPPAPAALSADSSTAGASSISLADELQKLVDLHNKGALTDAEFQAAKQRLLQGSSR